MPCKAKRRTRSFVPRSMLLLLLLLSWLGLSVGSFGLAQWIVSWVSGWPDFNALAALAIMLFCVRIFSRENQSFCHGLSSHLLGLCFVQVLCTQVVMKKYDDWLSLHILSPCLPCRNYNYCEFQFANANSQANFVWIFKPHSTKHKKVKLLMEKVFAFTLFSTR